MNDEKEGYMQPPLRKKVRLFKAASGLPINADNAAVPVHECPLFNYYYYY